jgi:hypothetical protein
MSLFDSLGDLVKQVTSGNAPAADVHAAYDQVAEATPTGDLADGLAHAFKSDQTPPFEQMVSGLFNESSPEQKTDFVKHLQGVLGPAGFAQALSVAGVGSGSQSAGQMSPETVQVLAQQAAAKDPSIIDKAASFYAQHPTLVKSIGVGALALLMRKVSASRR